MRLMFRKYPVTVKADSDTDTDLYIWYHTPWRVYRLKPADQTWTPYGSHLKSVHGEPAMVMMDVYLDSECWVYVPQLENRSPSTSSRLVQQATGVMKYGFGFSLVQRL